MQTPKILFKYKSFNDQSLDLLVSDKVYCANPADFNDPLDTKPVVEPDLPDSELKKILETLIEKRVSSKMCDAAKFLKAGGPRTTAHIERHSKQQAKKVLGDIAYYATDPMCENPEWQRREALRRGIEEEIRQIDGKGILSLAERSDCPLMWSHYGSEHRGICIGYKIPDQEKTNIHQVQYEGSRAIETSKIQQMLNEEAGAKAEVDAAVFLRKAPSWKYEEEWRFIGERGLLDSPFELAEIIFGSRCLDSAKYILVKALENRNVEFFEMRETSDFELKKDPLDKDELMAGYPRDNFAISSCFDDLTAN